MYINYDTQGRNHPAKEIRNQRVTELKNQLAKARSDSTTKSLEALSTRIGADWIMKRLSDFLHSWLSVDILRHLRTYVLHMGIDFLIFAMNSYIWGWILLHLWIDFLICLHFKDPRCRHSRRARFKWFGICGKTIRKLIRSMAIHFVVCKLAVVGSTAS